MKWKIGVMGSSLDEPNAAEKAKIIGKAIAKNNCILITGGSDGVPYEAVNAAKENNGFTVGISPAMNLEEHKKKYKYPAENFDVLIFTGFERKGRNIINIRSCDAVIFISGGTGTLNEFTISYDEGKICGVLEDSGGVSDIIREVEEIVRGRKKSGKIVYNSDPEKLVKTVIERLK